MKRARRHQQGYIFQRGRFWYLRYYEAVCLNDGDMQSVQKTHKLVKGEGDFKSKRAARLLADEFLRPFIDGTFSVAGSTSIVQFVEQS